MEAAARRLLLALFVRQCHCTSVPHKPNIVMLFIDDLGWSDTGCDGNVYHHREASRAGEY